MVKNEVLKCVKVVEYLKKKRFATVYAKKDG